MTYSEPNDTAVYPYPPGHPAGADEFVSAGEVASGRVDPDEVPSAERVAEAEARLVAHNAGLDEVTPIGDVGDPASAIIWAAHHHLVDVVVVGADARSWMSRLLAGSVERELLREADFAVLVVAEARDR